jgi:N-glycosylase/DNA lyase
VPPSHVDGILWFTVAIAGSCAVIALLAEYVQKARSFEKVSHRMEAVKFGLK